MKKLIALITAITSALCMFSACGNEISDNIEEKSSSKDSVNDITNDKTTVEIKEEYSETYESAVNRLADAISSRDSDELLDIMYSDFLKEIFEVQFNLMKKEYPDLEDISFINEFDYFEGKKVESEIISAETLTSDEIEVLQDRYARLKTAWLELKGRCKVENMILEQINDLFDDSENVTPAEDFVISEGYVIKCRLVSANDENLSQVIGMYAVYVEDEGWVLDTSFYSSDQKKKKTNADSAAQSMNDASRSVMSEYENNIGKIELINSSGYYIISNDPNKNYNIPENFDSDYFFREMHFFSVGQFEDMDFFVVMKEDWPIFFACEIEDVFGTYPRSSDETRYTAVGGDSTIFSITFGEDEESTYEALYEKSCEYLQSLPVK